MKRPLLAGAALGVIAFLAPQIASAQCEKRLTEAAQAVGTLPNGTDYRVHDTLNEFYHEAEGLMGSDEGGCLSAVQRMEDLIRRNGGVAAGAPGRSVGGSGGGQETSSILASSAQGGGGGAGSGGGTATASAGRGDARPGFVPIRPPSPFSAGMEERLAGLTAARRSQMRSLSDYVAAIRLRGEIVVDGASEPSDAVNEVARATNRAIEQVEQSQESMLTDRANALIQENLQRIAEAEREYDDAMNSEVIEGVLTEAMIQDRIDAANQKYMDAKKNIEFVQERLREIENANHDEGMAPGFSAAFRALEARHKQELQPLEAQWDQLNDEYQRLLAVDAINGTKRAEPLRVELSALTEKMTKVRERQDKELDDLYRQYSTMVIDLTQPDGRPAQEDGQSAVDPRVREQLRTLTEQDREGAAREAAEDLDATTDVAAPSGAPATQSPQSDRNYTPHDQTPADGGSDPSAPNHTAGPDAPAPEPERNYTPSDQTPADQAAPSPVDDLLAPLVPTPESRAAAAAARAAEAAQADADLLAPLVPRAKP